MTPPCARGFSADPAEGVAHELAAQHHGGVPLLSVHHITSVSGVRYEWVAWEHLAAVSIGIALLAAAMRVHERLGRTPVLVVVLALGALGMASLMLLAGRGYASTRPDVLYSLGYGLCCACACLFALPGPGRPPGEGFGQELGPSPWWPQFERDLEDYLRRPGPGKRSPEHLPVA